MSRFSKKKVGGNTFELTNLSVTNGNAMSLEYRAMLNLNGSFLCEVWRNNGEVRFQNGVQGFQTTIKNLDNDFSLRGLKWSYNNESITYNVAFIVNMIAVRMIDNYEITSAETSELAMRYERMRCKNDELQRRCNQLESDLCRVANRIRSMQVYSHMTK